MEVEIKAKCNDLNSVKRQLIKLKTGPAGTKRQLDQYYNLPHKDLRGTKTYVRLRKIGSKGIFALHENLNIGTTKETEVEVDNVKEFEKILEGLGLTKLGLIDKKREKFILGEFEVCLDKVKGIGSFVEIETQGNTKNWKQKRMKCIELLKKLGLNENSLTNLFLCDIATKKV